MNSKSSFFAFLANLGLCLFIPCPDARPCTEQSFADLGANPADPIEELIFDSIQRMDYEQFKQSFLGFLDISEKTYQDLREKWLNQKADPNFVLTHKLRTVWLDEIRGSILKPIRALRPLPLLGPSLFRTSSGISLVLLTKKELDGLPRGFIVASFTGQLAATGFSKIIDEERRGVTAYGLFIDKESYEFYLQAIMRTPQNQWEPLRFFTGQSLADLAMECGETLDAFKLRLPSGSQVEVKFRKDDSEQSVFGTVTDEHSFTGFTVIDDQKNLFFIDLDKGTIALAKEDRSNYQIIEMQLRRKRI